MSIIKYNNSKSSHINVSIISHSSGKGRALSRGLPLSKSRLMMVGLTCLAMALSFNAAAESYPYSESHHRQNSQYTHHHNNQHPNHQNNQYKHRHNYYNHHSTTYSNMDEVLSPEMIAAYEGFQSDADIIRLNHMKYWVDLIEEYHKKTGKYPLQGQTSSRLNVLVASPRQQQYTYRIRGIEEESMSNFVSTLEQGLGREIEEYYDPQYAPDDKPNYYIYMIHGDRYYFAIQTHKNYPFSRHVAHNYNKIEVSNRQTSDVPYILEPDTLFNSTDYQQAANKAVQKKAFFDAREALTLHATKEE